MTRSMEPPWLIGACSTVMTVLHSIASMPEWVQYAVEETEKSWPVAICLAAFMGWRLRLGARIYGAYKALEHSLNENPRLKRQGPTSPMSSSWGCRSMAAVTWLCHLPPRRERLQAAAHFERQPGQTLVTPFAAATMKPLLDLYVGPIPVGQIMKWSKVALDAAGGVGGGSLEIASAWTES